MEESVADKWRKSKVLQEKYSLIDAKTGVLGGNNLFLRAKCDDSGGKNKHRKRAVPWWLWPNLLSLDAPLVAVLWQVLLAHTMRIDMGWKEPLVLFLAVWTIYVADRALDVFRHRNAGWEPERKMFYRTYRRVAIASAAGLGVAAVVLALLWLPSSTLLCSGVVMGLSVLGYFAVVHAGGDVCSRLPRELLVGLIFAFGTFGPLALCCGPRSETAACSLIFSVLCWVNCSLIEMREWDRNPQTRRPGLLARLAAGRAEFVLGVTMVAVVLLVVWGRLPLWFGVAAAAAALGLVALRWGGGWVSTRFFRVAADGALCSPILVLLVMR